RMTRVAGEMLADIEQETVDFTPNYDESTLEPLCLPTRIPNLIVNGRSGIAEAYRTGRGKFLMRAKAAIENMVQGRQSIIVSEIPYQVNKSKLIERIADLVNDKVIDDISDVRDESDRDGMRIVIELKRGAEAQIVLNQLHKHTQMQEGFSMIFLAVVNGQPRELPLHEAIRHFIDHRVDVVRRRTAFLLRKAREREHILLGYQ